MPAVRFAVLSVALLLAAQPALAGTEDEAEIEDEEYDHKLAGDQSACPGPAPTGCIYIPVDIWNGWVTEAGDDLHFHIGLAQAPPSTFGTVTYSFHFNVASPASAENTSYSAVATVNQAAPGGDGALTPSGAATAVILDGTILDLTVPKDAVQASPGARLTGLQVTSSATAGASSQEGASDVAPDDGFGLDYVLAPAPAGNETTPPANETSSMPPPSNGTTSTPPPTETETTKASPAPMPFLALASAALLRKRWQAR